MRTTLALLLALSACSISEESFSDRIAEAVCKKAEECDDLVGSLDACIDDTAQTMQGLMDLASALGGEYDPVAAGECVRDVRAASCDSQDDAVDCNVYGDGE